MENNENAIEVRNLSIRYKTLKQTSIKKSLFQLKKAKNKEHEALKGISFDVKKGEILGIVGSNGSGKSTLLRAIAGIFSADSGDVNLYSNSVSLIAIGKGFDKNLTGRENIRLTGMLLGFSKAEIEKQMPRVIRFADLGSFIDMPVKTYSSGMFSKLSFAINTILLTDIILVDEVLSVGDEAFKKKSKRRMKKIINSSKRTVILVTHNMNEILKLCNRAMWLEKGEIRMIGDTYEVVEAYLGTDAFEQLSTVAAGLINTDEINAVEETNTSNEMLEAINNAVTFKDTVESIKQGNVLSEANKEVEISQ